MRMLLKVYDASFSIVDCLIAAAIVGACTIGVWACRTFGLSDANGAMVYLAAVAYIASRLGRIPAVLATILSVLSFPFFFIHQYLGYEQQIHNI